MVTKCPKCNEGLEADDKLAGQTVACPTCKAQFLLPVVDSRPTLDNVAIAHPANKNWNRYILLGCGFGILALLLIIVIAFLSKNPEERKHTPAIITSQEVQAIKTVFERDRVQTANFRKQLSELSENESPAKTMVSYAMHLRIIDLKQCPPAFQDAYSKHVNAWAEVVVQYNNNPNAFDRDALWALWDYFRGRSNGRENGRNLERDPLIKAILETWGGVNSAADLSGVGPSVK